MLLHVPETRAAQGPMSPDKSARQGTHLAEKLQPDRGPIWLKFFSTVMTSRGTKDATLPIGNSFLRSMCFRAAAAFGSDSPTEERVVAFA